MKKNYKLIFILFIITFTLTIFYNNCSEVDLNKLPPPPNIIQAKIDFCTTKANLIKSNLKFLFIMDRSGSNQQRQDSFGQSLPGTDPDGSRRFDALIDFVKNYQSDQEYTYWSLVNFNTSVFSGGNYAFNNSKEDFETYLATQKENTATIDSGWTNYKNTLEKVGEIIKADINNNKNSDPIIGTTYVIFFISDGEPRVDLDEVQLSNEILTLVDEIANLQEIEEKVVDSIMFNTAYYYLDETTYSQEAKELLFDMASIGKGSFLEFSAGQNIDITRFSIPQKVSRFALKEIFITNKNLMWDQNYLKLDSDGDSLHDELEKELGSDPFKADTDNNGVSDGVEFVTSQRKTPCHDPACIPQNAEPFTACQFLLDTNSDDFVYKDSDKDGLNDCEEKLLGSNINDPDSNLDYIPDYLSFRYKLPVVEISNAGFLDPDIDGKSNYEEIKFNTPIEVNNNLLHKFSGIKFTGGMIESNSTQDCYHFDVSELPVLSNKNVLKVYIMENAKYLNEKRIMRLAEKAFTTNTLIFTEEDFEYAVK